MADTTVMLKDSMDNVEAPVQDATPVSLINSDKAELKDKLLRWWNRDISFSTFKGKAKMHYEGMGMNQDFTANFRIANDSVIWIHITAGMGIVNVARMLVTPDSVYMVNYLQKEVTMMDINDINKLLPAPVDYSILQNLILGEVLDKKGTAIDVQNMGALYGLQMAHGGIMQKGVFNNSDSTLSVLQMRSSGNNGGINGTIQYGKYAPVVGLLFASERQVNIINNGRRYLLDMNFVSADFNEELNFPFSIPDSYTLKNY
ncbi:MAG: DUF4292 domain-containing protein [Chitinophagaceae bacterium]|nr:DUF4292 domain-containing protein [Chitinophagaceae bacterium]